MNPGRGAALTVATLLLGACVTGPDIPSSPAAPPALTGYLAEPVIRQLAEDVAPPPRPGSPEDLADRARSGAFRALEGGDRWLMATAHAELRPPLVAQHFDCALGARMTVSPMPALTRLMTRLQIDAAAAVAVAQTLAPRSRPAAAEPQRRVCVRLSDEARMTPSYPSVAATFGTADGELFTALAPDRAEAARRIGHEIGLSSAICAMAWPDDVSAGRTLGLRVYAAAATIPAFRDDLEAARTEVSVARAQGPANPGCAAERRLFGTPAV